MPVDGTYIIGRLDPGDRPPRRGFLAVANRTVSHRHAELVVLGGSYFLTDLGSRNGTWRVRNGRPERLPEGYVAPDERVRFGTFETSVEALLMRAQATSARA